ncbi:hypothetical protein CMT41_10300 [Colwellia sp. MT41]|uniref:TetR/AcrR family transcriptional regulator n=1 Tax=Colwellia sp. MT41 TaxID=58049 RepID=UPI0007178EF0|nr:TetR/AcrR family transcriptional regulator [Colwellia sp. MT41]ALO35063.1 hypothetical protein CMT41_10300 [Colwellia sp. MT41]
MIENPTSKRKTPSQQRAKSTVRKVLDGTWQLLKEQGADAITTRNIAKITGVSPGSIYQYFGNKEQILFTLYGERLKDSVGAFKLASTEENFSLSLAEFYQLLEQKLANVGWGRIEDIELTKAIAENPQLKHAVQPILNELYDCLIYVLRRYGSTWSEEDLKHLAEYIFGVNHFGYSLRIRQSEQSATKTIALTRELEYYLICKAVNKVSP